VSAYTPPIRRINSGRGHRYEDANGLRVPGVTTILKALPKDALVNWAGNATAEAAVNRWDELAAMPPAARLKALQKARYDDRDTAANRGTAVHKLAQRLVAGERVQMPNDIAGHVESYARFLDEWDVQPVLIEAIVMSHKHGMAGTLDLIADLEGLGRGIIDLKTSRSGVFGETALQLAGYRFAETYVDEKTGAEVPMIPVDFAAAVHVRANGYELIPVQAGREQYRALLYVQQVHRWNEDARDLIGAALTPPTTARYRIIREEVPA